MSTGGSIILLVAVLAAAGAAVAGEAQDPAGEAATQGCAESDAADSEPAALESISVTSRRIPEDVLQVPAAVGVVDREDIQRGRQQLGLDEALVKVPGLFLQNRYNFAQDLRVSSRGFGARSAFGVRGLKLFVDGIPATLPDGQTGVDSIDLGSAERIEVLRGPASTLYGAAAGGVLSIISERGPETPFVEGRFSVGQLGFGKLQLKAGGQVDSLDYLASLSQTGLRGYRDHSRTRSTLLNARLGYQIDESSELAVILNAVDSPRADDPGGLTRAEVHADRRQASPRNLLFDAGEKLDQQQLGLVYRKSFGASHEIALRNYYVLRDLDNRLPFRDGGSVDLQRFFAGGGLQYSYQGDVLGHEIRTTAGLDLDAQRDRRRRFDNEAGRKGALVFAQDEDVTATGLYLQSLLELGWQLELSAGARYDRIVFRVDDDFRADGDASGRLDFDELSPSLGLVWSPRPQLHVYGQVSTSFETPTTTELANPSTRGGFNETLDAQTATNTELGLKGLLPGRLRYDLAVFRIEVRDELVPYELPGMPGRSFFRNAGRSVREGLELAIAAEPLEGVAAALAYTYSDFRFERFATPEGVFDGKRLPGIPRHQLFGEISYRRASGFYAVWDALYVSDLYTDDANTERSGAYLVSNLRVGHRFRVGALQIAPFVGVINLFGRQYNGNVRINAAGGRFFEPAPGRSVYGGLTLRVDFDG